jgi:hypothetical protein
MRYLDADRLRGLLGGAVKYESPTGEVFRERLLSVEEEIFLERLILESTIGKHCYAVTGEFPTIQVVREDDRSYPTDDSSTWAI